MPESLRIDNRMDPRHRSGRILGRAYPRSGRSDGQPTFSTPGVATLAAFTLFITMFPAVDGDLDKDLDQALYFVGLLLAFGSGYFWLKGELPDPKPYLYALGTVIAIYVIGLGWGIVAGIFLSSMLGRVIRRLRRKDPD